VVFLNQNNIRLYFLQMPFFGQLDKSLIILQGMPMTNTVPLKKNYEFSRVYKNGRFSASKHLVVYVLDNKLQTNRLGITVSKKLGKAVTRNRIRRLIRENYRLMEGMVKRGYDLVIVSRKVDVIPSFYDIKKEMNYLLRKLDMINTEVGNQ